LGSFLDPQKTPLFDPFLTSSIFIIFIGIDYHHQHHHQRAQKLTFSVFSCFWKTEKSFSKVQIKYPLNRANYWGDPFWRGQATRSGEVMSICGRSFWITVPNHTILSARRPKLEVPTRRFSWSFWPSPLSAYNVKNVLLASSMMKIFSLKRCYNSVEALKNVILRVFRDPLKMAFFDPFFKTPWKWPFFDVFSKTRCARCVYIIKFIHAQ
jgi:hypothetical protein